MPKRETLDDIFESVPTVELVKAPADQTDYRQRDPKKEFFDRGERIIMLSAMEWARNR